MLSQIFLIILVLASLYISWLFLQEFAKDFGWFAIIVGIVIILLFAVGSNENKTIDEPIGEVRFGQPIYR